MSLLAAFTGQLVHVALILVAAPSLVGYIDWLQARLTGRVAGSWQRPWQNLARLARKHPVMAENASELFAVAPFVVFAATGAAAVLVPSFTLGLVFSPLADLLVIAGLLTLSRCAVSLAGMDTGSALGGMGASRTMAFACLVEPALLLVFATFGLLAGSTNLELIASMQQEGRTLWQAAGGLAFAAIVLVALVDTEAGPLSHPKMGAELAQLRRAMTLELSGHRLALVEAAAALRLLLWLDLIAALFLPFGMAPTEAGLSAWPLGLISWAVKLLLLATGLVLAATAWGHFRLPRVPDLLGIAILFALLAAAFLLASVGTA